MHRINLPVGASSGGPGTDKASQYGALSLLTVDKEVAGVGQVQSQFNSMPEFNRDRSLLCQQGATCTFGNLLSFPVGGGLLFLQSIHYVAPFIYMVF